MILGIVFLLGAVALAVLAWRALRRATGGARGEGMRIVVEAPAGMSAPRLRLDSAGITLFGPEPAEWAPPPAAAQALGNAAAAPGRLGGAAPSGFYRVIALVDLAGAAGSGDAALDGRVAEALGGSAMLLEPAEGGAPILLHGAAAATDGSIGGIALPGADYAALVARLGDPRDLGVEVRRRRIQRSGWGGERAQRRRAG